MSVISMLSKGGYGGPKAAALEMVQYMVVKSSRKQQLLVISIRNSFVQTCNAVYFMQDAKYEQVEDL